METIFEKQKEKQNQRWAEIKNRVGDYCDELDDISNMCADLEEAHT